MKTIGSQKHYIKYFFALMLIVLFGVFIFSSSRTDAVPIAQTMPPESTRLAVAGAGTEFNAPTSWVRIYVPAGQSSVITLRKTGGGSLSYFGIGRVSAGGSCSLYDSNTPVDGSTLTANGNSGYIKKGFFGGVWKTMNVYCLQISTTFFGDTPYWLTSSNGQSFIGNDKSIVASTGYVRDDTPFSGGGVWNKQLTFATPCGNDVLNARIALYDLDIGRVWPSGSQGLITATLRSRPRNGGAWSNVAWRAGSDVNASNQITKTGENENFDLFADLYNDRVYELTLWNINDVNAIKIGLPVDQIDGALTCGQPMTCNMPGLTTGTPGTYATITYTVNNNSGTNWPGGLISAPYNYRLNTTVVDTANPDYNNNDSNIIGNVPDFGSSGYIQNGVNGTANTVYNEGTDYRRYGAGGINAGNSRTYTIRILIPASGTTKTYAVRMFVRPPNSAFPYNWMDYSSTCNFQVRGAAPPVDGTISCGAITTTSITLNWTTTNTTNARIRRVSPAGTIGSNLPSTSSGTRVDSGRTPGTSYTYQLRNDSDSGTILDSVICTTNNLPPVCISFTNTPISGGFRLTWTSSNSTSASIDQGVGAVPVNGNTNVGVFNRTYTLTLTGPGGTITCQTTTVIPPDPSCTLTNSFTSGSYRVTWTFSNAPSITIDQGVGTHSSNGNQNVTPSWGSTLYTGTVVNAIGVSRDCTTTITVIRPSCTGVVMLRSGLVVASAPAGVTFAVRATLNNTNTNPIAISAANYQIISPPAGSSNTSGNATATTTIGATSSQDYRSNDPEDIIVYGPGTFAVEWDFNTPYGTIECDGTVTLTVQPLTCSANPFTYTLNVPFDISVTLRNPNYIPIPVSGSSWDLAGASPSSGFGFRDSAGAVINPANGGGSTVPAGNPTTPGLVTVSSNNNIIITSNGIYNSTWSVTSGVAGAAFSGCPGSTITIISQPYARFYGNDLIAGGSFESSGSCTTASGRNIKGNGRFSGANNHTTHQGMASELAVITTGVIERTLPGSQLTTRTRLDALSFANTGATGFTNLGGSFGTPPCADEYLSISTAGFASTAPSTGGANIVDFPTAAANSLFNIAETASSSIVSIGGNIDGSQRFQVYVNGDVIITSNIIYTSSGSWATIDDIPLLRVYARGNIYIDHNVSELNGMFVAGGTVHTCTSGSTVWNASTDDADILANCRTPLRIVGSVITNNIDLLRTNYCPAAPINDFCSVATAPATPEQFGSANIAEAFLFSPELYLALLSESKLSTGTAFDSLLSLPPAF